MSLGEAQRPTATSESDPLKGLKRAEFFLKAASLADDKIQEVPLFVWYSSRNPEVVADAVFNHQFGQVKDPWQFLGLLNLSHVKQDIWRGIALERLEQGDDLGFNPEEVAVLKGGLRIASIMDRIYIRYRKELIYSELGRKLAGMSSDEISLWLQQHGATNPYTVYKEVDGEVKQIPYAEAFSEEYQELDLVLDKLLVDLVALPEHSQPFIPYFEAYKKALMEKDPEMLEQRWKEVDLLWMDIKGPFQPIHAMEHYMDPTRTRIDPEFRIVIADEKDEKAKEVNEQALITQQRLIRDMSEIYEGYDSFNVSKYAIRNSVVLAGTTIVMSGMTLNFRPAGQVAPNRGEVRARKGVKIFMDLLTFEIRSKEMRYLLSTVFGDKFTNTYYVDPEFRIIAGKLTAGHEVNHNSFITPDTDSLLGNHALIEETKADLGPFITLPRQLERGEISIADLEKVLAITLAKALRNFKSRENPGQRPYYISSVVEFNLIREAGLVTQDGSQWTCDFSPEKIARFFELAQGAFTDLAKAYDGYSQEGLKQFTNKYFVETPEVLELVQIVKSLSS